MRLLSLTEFDNNFKIIYDFIHLLAFLQFLQSIYDFITCRIKQSNIFHCKICLHRNLQTWWKQILAHILSINKKIFSTS